MRCNGVAINFKPGCFYFAGISHRSVHPGVKWCHWSGSQLKDQGTQPRESAFRSTTRVAGGGGVIYGTLPVGRRATNQIIERSLSD